MADDQKLSNLKFNKMGGDPTLSDLLELYFEKAMSQLNCHAIATVQSFATDPPRVSATISYKKTTFTRDKSGNYNPTLIDYPIITDCPAIILGGGGANLTFPIAAGDNCILLFNDRDLDNWYQGQTGKGVNTGRMHSFSDAIALVGLFNKTNAPSSYDANRALLSAGKAAVGVRKDTNKVLISGDYPDNTKSLGALMQDIMQQLDSTMTQLQTLASSVCVPGSPIAPSVATQLVTLQNALAQDKTKLQALLE